MPAYLAKVNTLRRPILLIDAYAGPGIFDDGQPGSPHIMCEAAERYAKGNYIAWFINKDEQYHKKLQNVIRNAGWSASAHAYLADSRQLLQQIPSILKNHTVFLYLDPFGLKGCEFALLEPFLNRNPNYSTEILLTMNMPVVHRLAACSKGEDLIDGRIKSNRERLTKVFGGEYWRDILCRKAVDAGGREELLIKAYQDKLKQYFLPFTGSCPVRESIERRIKYFIVFASRHKDAMLLLNDGMVDAYFSRMHEAEYSGTLFEDTSWREMPLIDTRLSEKLEEVILDTVSQYPGATREAIWLKIVQSHFMRYHQNNYKKAVKQLTHDHFGYWWRSPSFVLRPLAA
jgi:three-Cys-motif partner protein